MLHLALTTQVCSQIVDLLRRRGWTTSRISRTIGASNEYVRRIEDREQSFQLNDVELLAKACKLQPHRLIFDSFQRGKLNTDERGLYDLTRQEVLRHREFRRVLMRKSPKKRRSRARAA